MTQSTTGNQAKKSLPIAGQAQKSVDELEQELALFEAAERERLGLKADREHWVDNMLSPKMSKKERDHVTLIVGGLTAAQDFLVEGALRGVGYKVEHIDVSTNAGLQVGKEFGNRGQCNPTYFTVGGLVKHLIDLREQKGLTSEEIVKNYIFFTAGACGPCRFGMYVTEYRKALRDAGFEGFRVMLFEQKGGLSQATGEESGLELNPDFFIGIIKALVSGDVINAMGYRLRPYEIEPGATNRAVQLAKKEVYKALYERTNIFWALAKCRRHFEAVKVDKLRPKAKVAIIGEFWAMTTEGDGNYALQKFLESEGAENDIQLTTAWLLYNLWEVSRDTKERMHLRGIDEGQYGLKGVADESDFGVAKRLATLRMGELGLRLGFQAFAQPAGLFDYHLADMDLVAEVAQDYYSNDLRGGEGHMEVGKLIVNAVHQKAHMTLSVKPFGCMPSSGVSDGVQSLITNRYPGTIYCAVETSGDGATNFYSRVQMYMFKARLAAQAELDAAYAACGVTEAEVRAFLDANPNYGSPLHYPPHHVAGTAANLVYEVAPLIKQTAIERAKTRAKSMADGAVAFAKAAPAKLEGAVAWIASDENRRRVAQDVEVVVDVARGKAKDRFDPLLRKLLGKAVLENNPDVAHLAPDLNPPASVERATRRMAEAVAAEE